MSKIRFAAVVALCLLVVPLESGLVRAASAEATLIVRLPRMKTPAKSITIAAMAAGTGDVLARQTITGERTQVALTVRAVPQVVVAEWLLSDGTKASGHSALLRPVDGGMLTVDVAPAQAPRPGPGKSFVMMNAAYRLPGRDRPAAAAAESSFAVAGAAAAQSGTGAQRGPMRIGVPADLFTVTGLDVSPRNVAAVVITDLGNSAACYGEGDGFVIVETDPRVLELIRAEIELSNSIYGDPATRITNRYVAPTHSVGGSWSSDGTTLTVTLRLVDAQGKQLFSKSATGPVSQFSEINARAAKALAAAISCPPRGSWSGTVTYSRTTASYSENVRDYPTLKTTQWTESRSIYYARITITGVAARTVIGAPLRATAVIAASNQERSGTHQVDSQGCSVRGPKVLDATVRTVTDLAGSATQALGGSLSINQDGSYKVSIDHFDEVRQNGTRSNAMVSTGWCDPEKEKANNYSRSEPITDQPAYFDGAQERLINISGRVDPKDPDTLQGTFTEKDPPSQYGPPGRTGETVITWNLRRAPAPAKK